MASNHPQPLKAIDAFILRRLGTLFESDVFAFLSDYPFIVRAFEFALADGALDATPEAPPLSGNYSERFWELNEQIRLLRGSADHWARMLVLIDLKSSTGWKAREQVFVTETKQQAEIGAFIAVCAADPRYIELYPNRFSNSHKRSPFPPDRKVSINFPRISYLPPSTYGLLSPCNSSYRMPISLLPQALDSLRHCAQGHGDYINPWTGVQFTGWRPHIVHDNEALIPVQHAQHFTSFQGVQEIWRGFRVARTQPDALDIDFELVSVQPRLADFKLTVPNSHYRHIRQQFFVQYKIDGQYRSPASPLTKVGISRCKPKNEVAYYFTDHERFDYLWYQFNFIDQQKKPSTKFFFLPESRIPDDFYSTLAKDADFSRESFKPYLIIMDTHGAWVRKVYDIIRATPVPRKPSRPTRQVPQQSTSETKEQPKDPASISRHIKRFLKKVFYTLMAHCAAERSGLVIVLSRAHPLGDFAYCRYQWTSQEQEDFVLHHRVPCTITQLPATTLVVPFKIYRKEREVTTRGPSLTTTDISRLNRNSQPRLLIFDLLGPDGDELHGPLLVIPSDDIRPTYEQLHCFAANDKKKQKSEFQHRVPMVAELLSTGLIPVDYIMSGSGPQLFEAMADPWISLWRLLDSMTGIMDLVYPPHSSFQRSPSTYRLTLRELHQYLVDAHALIDTPIDLDSMERAGEEEVNEDFD